MSFKTNLTQQLKEKKNTTHSKLEDRAEEISQTTTEKDRKKS